MTIKQSAFYAALVSLSFHLLSSNGWSSTVTATLRNFNGTVAPSAGSRMVFYTSPSRQISDSNPASFSSMPAGTFTLEGYYTGTFWGEEFWASTDVSVPSSGTVTTDSNRQYPIATTLVIKNNSSRATITPEQSIAPGTSVEGGDDGSKQRAGESPQLSSSRRHRHEPILPIRLRLEFFFS